MAKAPDDAVVEALIEKVSETQAQTERAIDVARAREERRQQPPLWDARTNGKDRRRQT